MFSTFRAFIGGAAAAQNDLAPPAAPTASARWARRNAERLYDRGDDTGAAYWYGYAGRRSAQDLAEGDGHVSWWDRHGLGQEDPADHGIDTADPATYSHYLDDPTDPAGW